MYFKNAWETQRGEKIGVKRFYAALIITLIMLSQRVVFAPRRALIAVIYCSISEHRGALLIGARTVCETQRCTLYLQLHKPQCAPATSGQRVNGTLECVGQLINNGPEMF